VVFGREGFGAKTTLKEAIKAIATATYHSQLPLALPMLLGV
jgi:hypothetical protein